MSHPFQSGRVQCYYYLLAGYWPTFVYINEFLQQREDAWNVNVVVDLSVKSRWIKSKLFVARNETNDRTNSQKLFNWTKNSWNPKMICFKIQSFAFHFCSWENVRDVQKTTEKLKFCGLFVSNSKNIDGSYKRILMIGNSNEFYAPFNSQSKLLILNFAEERQEEGETEKMALMTRLMRA